MQIAYDCVWYMQSVIPVIVTVQAKVLGEGLASLVPRTLPKVSPANLARLLYALL